MSRLNHAEVLAALRGVLGADDGTIALHEPSFRGNEWRYVKECLDSGWVSSVGKFVDRFEKDIAEYTGCGRAVAVLNGTAALHVCLLLVGVQRGDEVLIPTLTFVATANAVVYCGAVPHFVDSSESTLGLDPGKLHDYLLDIVVQREGVACNRLTGRPIRAVVPMHTFGHPVDLDPLGEICARFGIALVEDAAESLGSFYKGKHTGTFGRVAALSFNGNKIITTGGGGAILTRDAHLADRAKHLTTTARVPHPWTLTHDKVGFNYRLPNLNAALGCAQIEELPRFVETKRCLAERYRKAFVGVPSVNFFVEPEFAQSNYWLNTLLLDPECVEERDALLETTNAAGIMTRPSWTLMHRLSMYHECPRMDLAVAEQLDARIINIPSSAFLGEEGRQNDVGGLDFPGECVC